MQRPAPFLAFLSLLLLFSSSSFAQDSLRRRPDSLDRRNDTTRKNDTTRIRRFRDMNSLFADSAKLTSSDYQLRIEKTYAILSMIRNRSDLGPRIIEIQEKLTDSDSSLLVLKDNIINNSQALSLRNLQMFRTLLTNIYQDIEDQRAVLDSAELDLNGLRAEVQLL
ncbi:MAG: hypothetical protein EOO00_08335, partial [Chitinophagaceae bacterium]